MHSPALNGAATGASNTSRTPGISGPRTRQLTKVRVGPRGGPQQQPQQQLGYPQQYPQQAQQPQQPQPYRQPYGYQQPPYGQETASPQQVPRPSTNAAALVPVPQQPQVLQPSEVYLDFSLVSGKQVITRTQGRNLGTVSSAWVDPQRYEVVSLDIDDKKTVGSRVGLANVPLSRLTQIGDVVLVTDDTALYEPPMDGRFGYYTLTGMEVRTRSGEFLGKVSALHNETHPDKSHHKVL